MNRQSEFSHVTKNYLCYFYEILEDMITKMTDTPLNESVSHNFIVQMIPHHEAAVQMSRNLLQYTTFVPLQNIAERIIEEQMLGIEAMRNLLPHAEALTNAPEDLCLYERNYDFIAKTMFREMRYACSSNDINGNFIREMIPHHEGAIRMSQNALRYPICPGLIPILENILLSQEKGIREMQRLLRCASCR
ncbi:MAG: DUF305 domain-containing protein [Lachnospiraceae bacterium]|nr:DUF305 domain-containing protein [Lachnospiraceae bacterium]